VFLRRQRNVSFGQLFAFPALEPATAIHLSVM